MADVLQKVLERLRTAASEADDKARDACARSKYSVQDYWLCLEFFAMRLHDDLAREHNEPVRCPRGAFLQRVDDLRRSLKTGASA